VPERSRPAAGGEGARAAAGGEPVRVVLASRNRHKVAEIAQILDLPDVEIEGLDAWPEIGEIVEDGDTFEANARIKATTVATATGRPAMADDSGLVVDALGGRPGVHSARYSGPDANDRSNRAKLLAEMREVGAGPVKEGRRTARFVCVLCLALPDGETAVVEGSCEGDVLEEERGTSGFGYDPMFRPTGHARTFAEMAADEKNALSHRGRALAAAPAAFLPLLRRWAEAQRT
jgi:XTP/dITP diphosphohydrolase